jgi:hypothetical protein
VGFVAKKNKTFADIYKAVIKNAKTAAVAAAKQTAQKIEKDMYKRALDGLKNYYREYDPDVYDRTDYLKNAIIRVYEDKSTDSVVSIEIGIRYDESMLEDHYYSGSTKNPSYPEPEWILNNFLDGIHPRTTTGYKYNPARYIATQTIEMNSFIENEVEDLMYKYMNDAILKEFTKRMK